MVDRARLVKLLNLTESQHDGEALTAIRRSNEMLRRSKTSWEEVLTPAPSDQQQASPPPPEPEPERKPRPRTAGWGSDLFGEEASVPPPPKEKDERNESKINEYKTIARARIRSIPIFYRLVFFPIWAFAESYVTAVYRERLPTKLISIIAPLAVGALTGALWFIVAKAIVEAMRRV
jgi:hypothetical protein